MTTIPQRSLREIESVVRRQTLRRRGVIEMHRGVDGERRALAGTLTPGADRTSVLTNQCLGNRQTQAHRMVGIVLFCEPGHKAGGGI
jgi:hypothetical protein